MPCDKNKANFKEKADSKLREVDWSNILKNLKSTMLSIALTYAKYRLQALSS